MCEHGRRRGVPYRRAAAEPPLGILPLCAKQAQMSRLPLVKAEAREGRIAAAFGQQLLSFVLPVPVCLFVVLVLVAPDIQVAGGT